MASSALKEQLKNLSEAIMNVEEDKLLRASLGELSLERDFVSTLKEIKKKVAILIQYANELHDEQLQAIVGELESIRTEMEQQAAFTSQDYATNRDQFLNNIETYLGRIRLHWSPVVTTAIEARGLLDDEGIRQEYEHTIESIKQESESALKEVKEEANKTIEEARALAKEIEDRARFTATGISVEEAQRQFREAQGALDKRVKVWSVLGIVSILGFIVAALYFLNTDLPDQWRWQVVYHSSIRVSILTAIGTAAAFCLKILRAHLHMSEKNRHRQHVANSMAAFVQSAVTPEQRDLILGQLVESIVQFGNSGLVQREDDHIYRPKMTIDSITRTLSPNTQKES